MPASACRKNPMICSSVNLLFFMPVILHGDGLHKHYVGTAGRGQVKNAFIIKSNEEKYESVVTTFQSRIADKKKFFHL
jgi:hypothetical protein